MFKNISIAYSVMLMLSTKKNFESLGRFFGVVGKTIFRLLSTEALYHEIMLNIVLKTFKEVKILYLIFDDTLLKKIYSKCMEGSGRFYDTKIGRRIIAFKLLVATLSDGKISLPLISVFLFSSELVPNVKETRLEWVQRIIAMVQKHFPDKQIIVVADGAFGTKEFLRWCKEKKIKFEGRIRRNAVITYRGEKRNICDIETLKPVGRQIARTICAEWDGIPVYITAELRENKHEKIIVYQVANFKEKPSKHVKIYAIRWTIEKCFRTTKQYLGLQECCSTILETQQAHVAASLLAYSLLCLRAKKQHLDNPESAIRAANLKNKKKFTRYLDRLNQNFYLFNV